MPRIRHVIPNCIKEEINSLKITNELKTELIQLYKFDPVLTNNVTQAIINTNSIISYIDIVINDNGVCINCLN